VRGIALKIFVSFWLIFAVLIAIFALLPAPAGAGMRFLDHLHGVGAVASALLEEQGAAACSNYGVMVEKSAGIRFALVATTGVVLCGATDTSALGRDSQTDANSREWLLKPKVTVIQTIAPSGTHLSVAGEALPAFSAVAVRPPFPYRDVAFAIWISGLVCFATARYLARPLRLVRDTSYRLAAGDLHARAGPTVGNRRDEIGDLVRDFDAMAVRIEALMHAQTQLLIDISHELRSPLARLNVALELVRRKAGPSAVADLQRIEIEAERMNDLIGRVLTLARAENDRHVTMEPFDLGELVRKVTEDAHYEAQRHHKSVAFVHSTAVQVNGDARLIASAMDNVVRNALRYTPPQSVVLVTLTATVDEAVIGVRDRGPGVPDSELEQIFMPFHRVEAGRNRETGGVGLGLAIARRAVTLHGGTIVAGNVADGGLLVSIHLPLNGRQLPGKLSG
jgi:two-component system, OmpR family, sensor histidine kinase CpxA